MPLKGYIFLILALLLSLITSRSSKVIVTIFAGREKYLRILKSYLDVLLHRQLLDEIHLWDYSRNENDHRYVAKICNSNPKYMYKSYNKSIVTSYYDYGGPWRFYYEYYAISYGYHDNDILIKCDDDIVYIDVDKFPQYLAIIQNDGLYYANIVNNDVCAYIQTKYHVHNLLPFSELPYPQALEFGCADPLSGRFNDSRPGWWTNHAKAKAIHSMFLRNRYKFVINETRVIHWGSRVSINFFGSKVSLIKRYYKLYLDNDIDDEGFLSARILKIVGSTNKIVPFFSVVHFSFSYQHSSALDRMFLKSYYAMSEYLNTRAMHL